MRWDTRTDGRSQALVELARKAIALRPDDPRGWEQLAQFLTRGGAHDEALLVGEQSHADQISGVGETAEIGTEAGMARELPADHRRHDRPVGERGRLVEERAVLRALDRDPAGGSAVWGLDWGPVWATPAGGVSVEMIRTAKHRRKSDSEHRGCLRVTRLLL